MQPDLMFLLGIALPVMVVASFLLESVWKTGLKVQERTNARKNRKAQLARLPGVVRKSFETPQRKRTGRYNYLHNFTGGQIERIGWKIKPSTFITLSLAVALLGMTIVFTFSRDIILTITSAIIIVLIPFMVLNWATQKHEQKIMDQLPTAIQLFSIEFEMTQNIKEALERAAEGVGKPTDKYIKLCAKNLGASRPAKETFDKLAKSLNCEYGRMWAQMLLASTEDMTVVKLMPRLISRLSEQRLLQQKNIKDISGEKRIGIILNVLIIPGFILTQVFFSKATQFFYSPIGKLVIMFIFLSVIVGIMLDQLLRRVDL